MSIIFHRSAAPRWWGRDLPKHIIYLYKNFSHEPWKEYTIQDRIKEKIKEQKANLSFKRRYEKTLPCYIWVFYNKSWLFAGWYVYIECRLGSFALNWKPTDSDTKLLRKIMQKYHCGVFPEFADEWAHAFCKAFPKKPKGIKVKQGIKYTHCILNENNRLIDVL